MHDSKKSSSVANMGVKFSASINVRKQWLDIGKSKKTRESIRVTENHQHKILTQKASTTIKSKANKHQHQNNKQKINKY